VATNLVRFEDVRVERFKHGTQGELEPVGTFNVVVTELNGMVGTYGCASGPIDVKRILVTRIDGNQYEVREGYAQIGPDKVKEYYVVMPGKDVLTTKRY
jgi:hypothetical protein